MAPLRNVARWMMVMATIPVRKVDLVVPLAFKATAMRITETAGLVAQCRSGAVSPLSNPDARQGDVDSTNTRSTLPTLTMPSTRTSTMATRTTTTRTAGSEPVPSAAQPARHHADFSFEDLVQAYLDCRRTKRNSSSALAFEANLERNLCHLNDELQEGRYQPGKSICFVITRPKPREVWAADFRDRVVHHLLYNRVAPRFYASFIADSCACIPGRGTLYGAQRLEAKVRSITQNWSKPAHYLKLDLAKPWRQTTRRRTFNEALSRTGQIPSDELFETANSYFGLLRQATHSHHDRARLANVLRRRGNCINKEFTKAYRRSQ